MKHKFADIVIIRNRYIGLVCRVWDNGSYDVYCRTQNTVFTYDEEDVSEYVFRKEVRTEPEDICAN